MTENKFDKFKFANDFFDVSIANPGKNGSPPVDKEAEAYTAGEAAGRQAAEAEIANLQQQHQQFLTTLAQEVKASHEAFQTALTTQALTLVLHTCEQLLGDAAENYPADILDRHLRQLIENITETKNITLKLNPQAAEFHKKLAGKELELNNITMNLVHDTSLSPTDCVAEWHNGGLRYTLAELNEHFRALFSSAGGAPLPTTEEKAGTDASPSDNQAQEDLPADEPSSTLTEKDDTA